MSKVFVTGANGFIGSHLVRKLVEQGHEVSCLIRHTSDISSLRGLPVTLHIGDVKDPESLIAPMKGVEYIYHLAAELMVTNRNEFEETNTQGTINMLECAKTYAKTSLKRFLLVSSQAAAGPGKNTTPLNETNEPQPMSWYGTSKKKAEDAVMSFSDQLNVTIVRPSAVYGEREKDISQTFNVVEYRIHPKLGILKKYVVMVYVADLVLGIINAAEHENTIGQTYFLNHPEILTAKNIIKITARAMNKSFGLTIPAPLFLLKIAAPFTELIYHFFGSRPPMTRDKAKEVSQRFWISDPSKAKNDFNWEAKASLLDGMKPTITAFRNERNKIREMPEEKGVITWLKYAIIATLLGAVLEFVSYIGDFYQFHPSWIRYIVIVGAFGIGLGSFSRLIRKTNTVVQFICATAVTFVVEALNDFFLHLWEFTPGWPFGITNAWFRSLFLGMIGGVFVLVINNCMKSLYKRRLRLG